MGLICAKKELFDNNYDPDTIVKCFLVVDFDLSLIGIRSVDSGFSAMITFDANDLIRVSASLSNNSSPQQQDDENEGPDEEPIL